MIRLAEPGDLLPLLQLLSRSEEGRGQWPEQATATESAMWDRMLATEDVRVYVADDGEALVGTATFLVLPNITYDCRPTGFIEAMVVSMAHRRQGLASRILQRLLDDARELGCHKIQLLTHKNHALDGAHDLYRANGFTAEAEGFRLYLD